MTLTNKVNCDRQDCPNHDASQPNSVVDLAGWLVVLHQQGGQMGQMAVDAHLCPECRRDFFKWLKEPRRTIH